MPRCSLFPDPFLSFQKEPLGIFSNQLICPSVTPRIPSGPGPNLRANNSLALDAAGEKRQAWEKGPEEKLAGGKGWDNWGNSAFKPLKIKGEEVGERNQKI